MARALSTATLSLGLVAIPVGLHATRRRAGRIAYHLVHAADGSRVKRQYVCEEEGVPVDDSELARAYEGDDGPVVMSAEEAKAAAPKSTARIDLIEFVPRETVDAIYFDNAYFLAPGKGGDRAYHLLAATLRELDVVGIGTQLARGKSYLIALRATELGLTMHTLHHADEVHDEDAVPHGEPGRVTAAERELAHTLVEQLRRPAFDASRYEDEADVALRKVIAAHEPAELPAAKGKAAAKPVKVIDLLASLRASLEAQPAKRTATKKHAAAAGPKRPRRHAPSTTKRTPRQRRSGRTADAA